DREIEIERRLLEDDSHARQGRRGLAVERQAEDADRPAPMRVEPRHEREERALAGAVQPQKNVEASRPDREGDVVERAPNAVGVGKPDDFERDLRLWRGRGGVRRVRLGAAPVPSEFLAWCLDRARHPSPPLLSEENAATRTIIA